MANENMYLYQNQISENDFLTSNRRTTHDVPLHWHNYVEIELVLAGTAEHIHNGIVSQLKKGHVSLFRINDYHAIKNSNNLEVFNLSIRDNAISERTLTQLNSTQSNLSFELDEETFKTVLFFCEACTKENSLHNRNEYYIKNLLECILILLLRLDFSPTKTIKKHQNSQLNSAINYLHNHFRENPNLNTIAKIAHYSSTHFSHVFHKKSASLITITSTSLKSLMPSSFLQPQILRLLMLGIKADLILTIIFTPPSSSTQISPPPNTKRKRWYIFILWATAGVLRLLIPILMKIPPIFILIPSSLSQIPNIAFLIITHTII